MFVKGTDDADCLPEFKKMFDDLRSTSGKTELNKFLEDAKQFLDDPRSARPDGGGDFPTLVRDGFVRNPVIKRLEVGTIIDRYGDPSGRFISPAGTTKWARSLPPGSQSANLKRYRVIQAFDVDSGRAAPWFAQPGGGEQFKVLGGLRIQDLIPDYLEEMP